MTTKLDTFTAAYIEAALWSESRDSSEGDDTSFLDAGMDTDDIHPDSLAAMITDCQSFQQNNQETLEESELSDDYAGHTFWLDRVGSGVSFTDRCYGADESIQEACDRLHASCKRLGEVQLYLGDDNKIHLFPPPDEPYTAYRRECEKENLNAHDRAMWLVHGSPTGPI